MCELLLEYTVKWHLEKCKPISAAKISLNKASVKVQCINIILYGASISLLVNVAFACVATLSFGSVYFLAYDLYCLFIFFMLNKTQKYLMHARSFLTISPSHFSYMYI